jgi:hypothetical protein
LLGAIAEGNESCRSAIGSSSIQRIKELFIFVKRREQTEPERSDSMNPFYSLALLLISEEPGGGSFAL